MSYVDRKAGVTVAAADDGKGAASQALTPAATTASVVKAKDAVFIGDFPFDLLFMS